MPARAQGSRSTPVVPLDEERAVVERVRRGDRAAFSILYRWYGDAIYRTALARLGDPVQAEDVLRETFRRALERLPGFAYRDRSIYWWLRRIAIHLAMDQHRQATRDQKVVSLLQAEPGPAWVAPRPDRAMEQADMADEVARSLALLNPRYAKILRWRLLEERERDACAEALGVTVGHLDVLLHRACKAFKKVYPP